MKKNRILALVLAVLMVAAIAAGCANTAEPDTTTASTTTAATTTAATTTEATTTEGTTAGTTEGTTTEATTTETEPAGIDLGGYEFVWVKPTHNATGRANMAPDNETALGVELGEIYAEIEEELNCIITIDQSMSTDLEQLLTAAVGGDKYADAICTRQYNWIPLAAMGGIRALDSSEMLSAGFDLYNNDVYNQIYTQMTKINGHVYGFDLSGKFDNVAMGHFYGFNKRIIESAGYSADDIYNAVRNGTWTYEYFLEIAHACVVDVDGDGLAYPVNQDVWGIALDGDGNEAWTNGTGPIFFDEATGKYMNNLSDPQFIKAMEFMSKVNGEGDLMYPEAHGSTPQRGDRREIFYSGHAGFAGLYGGNVNDSGTGTMEDDFGIVPFPKGPDADGYVINMVDLDSNVILVSNRDYEKTALIFNAIGARVTDFDAYKELVLESFRGDEDAVDVLFNYAFPNAFMNICKCSSDMHNLVRKKFYSDIYTKNMSVAQAAETYGPQIQAELDKVFHQ